MMAEDFGKFENYFAHLQKTNFVGRAYKRFISSPILYFGARFFGSRIIEVGSGTGSGVLGSFPKYVQGLEINPYAVEYCKSVGLDVLLIKEDGLFPVADGAYDACILDNVLEHIEHPRVTLDECHRITGKNGGLVIAVPGLRGYQSDSDHKIFYDEQALLQLDERWKLQGLRSIPFGIKSEMLSKSVKQYCLVAIYKKTGV